MQVPPGMTEGYNIIYGSAKLSRVAYRGEIHVQDLEKREGA